MQKKICQIYEKFKNLSFRKKLLRIIFIHFMLSTFNSIIFFLDDFSIFYQLLSSIIHITFFSVLMDGVYARESSIWINKTIQRILLTLFIVINTIPLYQPFLIFDDTPLTASWEILPQTKFGFPFTYLRLFPEEAQQMYEGNNPLIVLHINFLFCNLYTFGLLIILSLKLKNRIRSIKK